MLQKMLMTIIAFALSGLCSYAHAQTLQTQAPATQTPTAPEATVTPPTETLPRCVLDYYSLEIRKLGFITICEACEKFKPVITELAAKYPILDVEMSLIKGKDDPRIQWAIKYGGIKYFFPAVIVWFVQDGKWQKIYSANYPLAKKVIEGGINKCLAKLAETAGAAAR